jgi:DNA-binding transcriptional regulator YiaG
MKWDKDRIRQFRKSLNLTQRQFGDLIGVSEVYVRMLELGIRKPSKVLKNLLECIKKERGLKQ